MSKELTEKWNNGTLPQGYYYIVANTEQKHNVVFYLPERNTEDESRLDLKDRYVLEVLSNVPRYNEYKELVSKNEQLSQKIEELKQQLAEANKILFNVWDCREDREYYSELVKSYFEKYGVDK